MVKTAGPGGAMSKKCPRQGFVRMKLYKGGDVVTTVNCRTWGCLACRDRKTNQVKAMIRYGISTLGPTYLITLTLRLGKGESPKDAKYVAAKWKRYISILQERSPNLSWMRIVELTKKRQPHLHLVVGGIGDRKFSCAGVRHAWSEEWVRAQCREDCLEHEWSALWLKVTGDSYIVNVRPVMGASGAAAYLAKYLGKGVMDRDALEELGFLRRWSCSNNWPRGQLQTRGVDGGYYESSTYFGPRSPGGESAYADSLADVGHPLLELVGEPALVSDSKRLNKKRLMKIFGGYLDNKRSQDVSKGNSGGDG